MTDEEMWNLERKLWLDGAELYAGSMDEACVMAVPGMGVMKATEVLDSLRQAPRWSDVEMSDRLLGRADDEVIALAHRAKGMRDGQEPYHCFCTSTYRRADTGWLLIQHQQTLAE